MPKFEYFYATLGNEVHSSTDGNFFGVRFLYRGLAVRTWRPVQPVPNKYSSSNLYDR